MKISRVIHSRFGRSSIVLLALGLAAAFSAPPALASSAKKHLSMTSITVNGAFSSADFGQIWIAARGGFFAQQGITHVNLLNTALSGAQSTTVLLAGASQFVVAGGGSMVQADQVGGSVRAVAALDYGSTEELAINAAVAAAHHIPVVATTPAQAKAQLLALRGSHLNIAVSTTGSDGYTWLVSLLKLNGLTVDANQGSSADVNVVPVGNVPTAVAAVASGKMDGIANTPPNTVFSSPSTVTIPLHLVAPANQAIWGVVSTSQNFINQHGDVVQAFMNGLVAANQLAKVHPAHAFQLYSGMMNAAGVTSPEEIQYLWAGNRAEWVNLIPTRTGYAKLVTLINSAGATSVSVPYTTFVSSKFAINAYKANHLPVPTQI